MNTADALGLSGVYQRSTLRPPARNCTNGSIDTGLFRHAHNN